MKKIILLFVALVSLFVFQNNVSADDYATSFGQRKP